MCNVVFCTVWAFFIFYRSQCEWLNPISPTTNLDTRRSSEFAQSSAAGLLLHRLLIQIKKAGICTVTLDFQTCSTTNAGLTTAHAESINTGCRLLPPLPAIVPPYIGYTVHGLQRPQHNRPYVPGTGSGIAVFSCVCTTEPSSTSMASPTLLPSCPVDTS